MPSGGISKEDLDTRRQSVKVDEAAVDQALQAIYAIRVGLGLLEVPPEGKGLGDVPPDLADNFSGVRQALGQLLHSAAELGYTPSFLGRHAQGRLRLNSSSCTRRANSTRSTPS